jgi:hypothetical protein
MAIIEIKNLHGDNGDGELDKWFAYYGGKNELKCYALTEKDNPDQTCKGKQEPHSKYLVGGHVKKVDGRLDDDWYILPICKTRNNNEETYFVDDQFLAPLTDIKQSIFSIFN